MEAFIYQRVIDEGTYKDQLDKLNESMAMAEINQHDQRTEELDIEAVLGFAERVSLNAPRLWLEASLDQRQRFQAFLFPEGIQVADRELRTPVTTSFYERLHSFTTQEKRLVEQLRGSWNSLLVWLRDVQAWSQTSKGLWK